MSTLMQDVRTTVRGLLRSPGFTSAAVLTIACAIAVNTAIFSVVHGVLLSPLPYPQPDRLTFIWKEFSANLKNGPLSPRELMTLRRGVGLYEGIAGLWSVSGTLVAEGRPESLRLARVTSNFFDVLGVAPLRGRNFTLADEADGPPNMIISWDLWQRRFGGDEVLGRVLDIEGGWGFGTNHYRVIGIMPRGFEVHMPDPSVPRIADAWVPFQGRWAASDAEFLRTVARLTPGATVDAAQEQIARASRDAHLNGRIYPVPLHAELVRDTRPILLVLQAAVGFVLLVACISVAILVLVRAQERQKEIAIRTALGALPRRLARLLLTESLVIAAAGGLFGVALADLGLRLLPLLDSGTLPRVDRVTLNGPVLAVSALASIASGLLFGFAPLLDIWRGRLESALKSGGRSSGGAERHRARRLLVVAEIALSVMLLIGAGLLVRTFLNLYAFNPGFRSTGVLAFRLSLPGERYRPKGVPVGVFVQQLERDLGTVTGVQSVGAINQLPLDDEPNFGMPYCTRATAIETGEAPLSDTRIVSPHYLQTIGAQLVAGRWFTEHDDAAQPRALIIDERLARNAWPGRDPIGQELQIGGRVGGEWGRVVGVIRHIRHHRVTEEVREEVFIPFAQWSRNQMSVVVRAQGDPTRLLPALTERLHGIDPNLSPSRVRPFDDLVARSRAPARFSMVLTTLFAAFSLMLACLSQYGVISYSVAQRTLEFGLRTALGASGRDLVRMITGQAVVMALVGIGLGLGGAILVARSLRGLLFGVSAFDPLTFVSVPLLVGAVALLACYMPARRAAKVEPIVALKDV